MSKGFLIVIEGIDGSGKTTQVELLQAWEVISFPRYEDNLYGKLIKKYLEGEFGKADPYLIALAYAGDRTLANPLIESWLSGGKVVIANRYVSSSKAHLSANLPVEKREEFMRWIDKLEYETNGIPKEDLTILLDVDPKKGQANVEGDLHEDDLNHLIKARKIYLELSKAEENWRVVNCMEGGKMARKEKIHKQITAILNNLI